MNLFIETERLILRELHPNDIQGMYTLDSNPEVHRYLGNNPVTSIEQIKQVIDFVIRQYHEYGIGRCAVIEKSSGEFVGWSGLKYITEMENNQINYYDVGYRLIPKFWGKGYATESAKACIEYGFKHFDMNKIVGCYNENNKASQRVLEKCGLSFKEKFMWNDICCDWMEISREAFEKL